MSNGQAWTMESYLKEIEYAVTHLMEIMWSERSSLANLENEVERLTRQMNYEYSQAYHIALNAEDADDVMLATGRHWETYFGSDRDRYYRQNERDRLAAQVEAHTFSVSALAGAVLQYAHQGVLLVQGRPPTGPAGRSIGSQSLRDIISAVRNQAMHWEEQDLRNFNRRCFDSLAQEIDPKFAEYNSGRNLAMDIVELLEWRDFERFRSDLTSLEPGQSLPGNRQSDAAGTGSSSSLA